MNKTYFALFALILAAVLPLKAQIVTTTPEMLQEGSRGVVLTYHADSPLGNKGLMNLSSNFDVYAHIGVITSKSGGEWTNVVAPWPETGNQQAANTDKNRLTRVDANTYTLSIGDIRTFFGITDATEKVTDIAIVFRNADGSKTGRTSSGGDIFIPVLEDGFRMQLTSDHPDRVIDKVTTINYTVMATQAATLTLSVDGKVFATKQNTTSLTAPYTFSSEGNYIVKGTAEAGSQTLSSTLEVSWPSASLKQDYPGGVPKMGAVKNADGTVTFCIAAPGKVSAVLVGQWNNYEISDEYKMKYQDYKGHRYFWTTVSGLANDQWYGYYHLIDDKYKVADPYAHMVLDCYNDAGISRAVWKDAPKHPGVNSPVAGIMLSAYRGDIDDYTFSPFTIPEHDNLVIYEMLFRDFTGLDGKALANGTVKKAIDKIPYIKSLGFNAVELMPIMEFNGNNSWGYNTNFYMAPDKAYGSPTDYRDFIEECHKNGIAVILDIVFNQSDGLHPWYQLYDIDSNPFYNKVAPHAWSVLNDWNQDHPLVQQQWTDALVYWLEKYNVDGFRFDLVKGLGDNGSYANGTDAFNQSRIDRMKRLHGVIKSVKPDGIHINELLGGAKEEIQLGLDGQLQWANVNNNSCQYAMGYDSSSQLSRFLSSSDGNRPWGSTVAYAESHDEQRVNFKSEVYGKNPVPTNPDVQYNRLAQLAVQMLMTPGPKMVWMFGELGNSENTKEKPDGSGGNNTSPKVVDWRWLDDPHKAFLKDVYAAVINLRTANPELVRQSATFNQKNVNMPSYSGRSMRLTAGSKEAVAFINPSLTTETTITVNATNMTTANAKLICASKDYTPALSGAGTSLSLTVPANGFAVFATNNVEESAGIDAVVSDTPAYALGSEGCIIIQGEYNTAHVYDLSGRMMPSLTVPAGLYIVNIDGHASKVLVH